MTTLATRQFAPPSDFHGQRSGHLAVPRSRSSFQEAGILPVSRPLGEVLPAMQNRTIDGL